MTILNRQTTLFSACLLIGLSSLMGCSLSPDMPRNREETVKVDGSSKEFPDEAATVSPPTLESDSSVVASSELADAPQGNPESAPEGPTTELSSGVTATENIDDDVALQSDPIEPADLVSLTLNLPDAQGMPYGDVRDRIIASGWIPHTFAGTTGPDSDFHDSTVQAMEQLGFSEVKFCSGTGQGFCRFEFVYEDRTADNGPLLVITTAAGIPSEPSYPMPSFWSFRQENISDLTYSDRPFDPALFAELQERESFCLGVGQCDTAQYRLKDALLVSATGGFGTATMTLIPDSPISKEEAIAYAQILDQERVIDFANAQADSETSSENYYEAGLQDAPAESLGGITTVRLQLAPSGQVSTISYSLVVL